MAGISVLTPSKLIWQHSGSPDLAKPLEPTIGYCATCAQPITEGVPVSQIITKEFYGVTDFFKFGTHVCHSCAWLYWSHKTQPHSFFVTEIALLWPTISIPVGERPTWRDVLSSFVYYSSNTPVAALLTTDTKPRVWPHARMSVRGHFRMYIHAPAYDLARMLSPDLELLLELYSEMEKLVAVGYSKRSILSGLYNDRKSFNKDPQAWQHERNIAKYRNETSASARDTFLLALITTPKEVPEDG